jgi:hypothetical protein
MSFEITGKLLEVYPVTTVSDKFKKREFVLEKTETKNSFDFTDYIKFQLVQDKCNLIDLFRKGDEIKVSFNLRGRRWEKDGSVNYFTNLEAWKIEKNIVTDSEPEGGYMASPGNNRSQKPEPPFPAPEIDDLPF